MSVLDAKTIVCEVEKDMSDFLFARASLWFGIARTLDLAAQFDDYNISLNPEQADYLALRSDMNAVGQDFWAALDDTTSNLSEDATQSVEDEEGAALSR